MDLKVMPRSTNGCKYILVIIKKVTSFLTCVPVHYAKSDNIGEILGKNMITNYGCPDVMIMDQDNAFMSMPMSYFI